MDSITLDKIKYEWLGQSCVRVLAPGTVLYTDPVILDENPPEADLILITHHHVDHCLPEFITPIRNEKTKLAAFHESYVKYCAQDIKGVRTVKVGQTIELAVAMITGTEAYTKRGFHIKGEGCGFLIELSGQRIYFSGDTSRIPEMSGLGKVDVAIMPIADNAYAIDMKDIAEAVREMNPRLFIPVHYTPADESEPKITGEMFFSKDPSFFTKKEDPGKFASLLEGSGVKVAVLRKLGIKK
ncbi:MAG: MBL fold metallo-hydrolase [Deltaproteobacteria bacterium]|nr:MBL fold metallo-hydrolase [Deltaproteobacteria bacterium]